MTKRYLVELNFQVILETLLGEKAIGHIVNTNLIHLTSFG